MKSAPPQNIGMEGLKRFNWRIPCRELVVPKTCLEKMFREDPPHTTAKACRRIEEATGVKHELTQVRRLLKKVSV